MSDMVTTEDAGATNMLAVIQRAASDPSVDMDKLERLIAVKERMDAKQAETDFNAAMSRAQAKMGPIAADAVNPQTKSRYASYAALDRALRPIYTSEGFSLSFSTEPAPAGHVGMVCYASHANGHTREYRACIPSDGKGIKGNDMMTSTHAFGSGMTYGQRYLLKLIFNVAVGEDDDDGNRAGATTIEFITEEQEKILRDLVDAYIQNEPKFMDWIRGATKDKGVQVLADIQAQHFDLVHDQLGRIRKQKESQA
jgi:hypothetical protein